MNEDKSAVIEEILSYVKRGEVGPNDVTMSELAEHSDVGRNAIRKRMERLVEQGIYGTEIKFNPASRKYERVYWKA